jgi:Flp pilus assembly protein TadD
MGKGWSSLGTAYMMRKQSPEAIRACERAVALDPAAPRARNDLGTAYLALNRPDLARHCSRGWH